MVSVGASAEAQTVARQEALGVRILRGERLPAPFGLSLVAPTADGFVAVTIDDRLAGRLDLGREPFSSTEFFYPDDVVRWTTGINSLIAWVRAKGDSSAGPIFTLGGAHGLAIQASGVVEKGRWITRFDVKRCYNYVHPGDAEPVNPEVLLSVAAQFRRAANRAQAIPLRESPNDAVWYGHAVTCPAVADFGNVPPPWPASARELRPRQEVVQLVVDANGRVEPGSERFMASSDPRFAASIRGVLPSWRFTPARRMMRPVRQLVHLNVGFTPPIVFERGGKGCPDEKTKAVVARLAPGTRSRHRPDSTFLRGIAQAFASDPIAWAMRGASLRFGYDRWGGMSKLQFVPPERAQSINEMERQMILGALGGAPALPAAFGSDTVALQVEFGLRCEIVFTAVTPNDAVSMVPQGDGMIRVANAPEVDGRHLMHERSHTAVTLPAGVLRQFVDTVARLLPAMDTTGPIANGPDYAPDAPMLGAEYTLGLNMWLSRTGWIRAGFLCGRSGQGQARFLEISAALFPEFRRAALAAADRIPLQPEWTPRGNRPYLEHELTCHPGRVGHHQIPTLPRVPEQASVEVPVIVTIDESGNVEPDGVEIMPGLDSVTRASLLASMKQWTFQPGVVGNTQVRTQTHINLIIRPVEADAVVLTSLTREVAAEDTLPRTIFYKAPPQPRFIAPLIERNQLQRSLALFQPHIDRAKQSWPEARNRFITGLPLGAYAVVTTLTEDNLGNSSFAFVRVDRVVNGVIHGRLWRDVTVASEWSRGDVLSFPETALIDWRIIRSDGSHEGNFLGAYLEGRVR